MQEEENSSPAPQPEEENKSNYMYKRSKKHKYLFMSTISHKLKFDELNQDQIYNCKHADQNIDTHRERAKEYATMRVQACLQKNRFWSQPELNPTSSLSSLGKGNQFKQTRINEEEMLKCKTQLKLDLIEQKKVKLQERFTNEVNHKKSVNKKRILRSKINRILSELKNTKLPPPAERNDKNASFLPSVVQDPMEPDPLTLNPPENISSGKQCFLSIKDKFSESELIQLADDPYYFVSSTDKALRELVNNLCSLVNPNSSESLKELLKPPKSKQKNRGNSEVILPKSQTKVEKFEFVKKKEKKEIK